MPAPAPGPTPAPSFRPQPEPEPEPEPKPQPEAKDDFPAPQPQSQPQWQPRPPAPSELSLQPSSDDEDGDDRVAQVRAMLRESRAAKQQAQQPPPPPAAEQQPVPAPAPAPVPVPAPAAAVQQPREPAVVPTPVLLPFRPAPPDAEPPSAAQTDEEAEIERRVLEEVERQLTQVDEQAQAEAERRLDAQQEHEKEAERLRLIGKELLAEQRQRDVEAGVVHTPRLDAADDAQAAAAALERERKEREERQRAEIEAQVREETERRFKAELMRLANLEVSSASLIQAAYRGWSFRRTSGTNFGRMRRHHVAAITIQSARRGQLGRRRAAMHRRGYGAYQASLDGTLLRRLAQRRHDAPAMRHRTQSSRQYFCHRTDVYDALLKSVVELDRQRPVDKTASDFVSGQLSQALNARPRPGVDSEPPLSEDLLGTIRAAFDSCATDDTVAVESLDRLLFIVSCRLDADQLEQARKAVDPDDDGSFRFDAFSSLMRRQAVRDGSWAWRLRRGHRSDPMSYYASSNLRGELVRGLLEVDAAKPDQTRDAVRLLARKLHSAAPSAADLESARKRRVEAIQRADELEVSQVFSDT